MMNPFAITQKLLLVLVILALFLGIWQSQTGLRAAALFERSQRLQEAWTESPESLTVENWLAAGELLFAAISLDEQNGEYLHQYGLLLDIERSLPGANMTAQATQQILTDTIESHRLGIRQQPTNPHGWAYFVRAKALAEQLDNEFELGLERVYTLAPWNREIQIMVAQIASYFWPNMSQNGRHYSTSTLQLALSNPGSDTPIINLLQGNDFLLSQLCPALDQTVLTKASMTACDIQPER